MKSVLILTILFVGLALCQQKCCAPSNWRGTYRTYADNGKIFSTSFIFSKQEQAAYLSIFYQSQGDTNEQLTEL